MQFKDLKEFEQELQISRSQILDGLTRLFSEQAIEAHVFGSLARGDEDAYSDIDIWFTFSEEDFSEIHKNRFNYYKKIGDIFHSYEPPQNAPIAGVQTTLFFKNNTRSIIVVDISLCPFSTSFIPGEGKRLFGTDIQKGEIGLNPQKVEMSAEYRIDFFIGFIFNSIKKLVRKTPNPFAGLFREYEYLHLRYRFCLPTLDGNDENLETLERIIKSVETVANEKQKNALVLIKAFARRVLESS